MLPETDKNIYVCDAHARHLSPAIDELRYHPIFNNIFGGVVALSTTNYQLINGFSNRYAGWGNEDDDMSARTYGAGKLILSLTIAFTVSCAAAKCVSSKLIKDVR